MKYFLLLVLVVDSMQRCSHPQSDDGGQVREGCLLRTCKDKVWRSSLVSNICCYDGKPYTINTTISYTMSEDGCAKAAIDCVEETPGNTKMVLSVKNNCEDYATKDQQEDIKEMMVDTMKAESACQEENVEMTDEKKDPKVLLIGPGVSSDGRGVSSGGKSEVLSLPDLTPLDCNIPVFPGGDWSGYVGRSTSDGVLMCGGYVRRYEGGYFMSSCYLLTSSGYQDMPPLINLRGGAASLVTPLGLWVTGGFAGDQDLDTTEVWNNNQSQPHVRLPEGLSGHCLTSVNKTHILLTGGFSMSKNKNFAAAYIFSEEDGFTRIQDMKTPRRDHGCSVINDSTVVVAGGILAYEGPSTEYLDLNSLKWMDGPELPEHVFPAKILGPEELGSEIGGHLLIGEKKIFKLEEEGLTQTRQWTMVGEMKYSMAWAQAFVVNQNMIC